MGALVCARLLDGDTGTTVGACNTLALDIFRFDQRAVWIPDGKLLALIRVCLPRVCSLELLTVEGGMFLAAERTGYNSVLFPDPEGIGHGTGGSTFSTDQLVCFFAPSNFFKEMGGVAQAAHEYVVVIPGVPLASARTCAEDSIPNRVRLVHCFNDLTGKAFHVKSAG